MRRDVIDQRIVREVKNGTYTYIGSKPEEDGKAKQPGIIDTVSDTEGYIKVKSLNPWPDTDGDGIPDIWEEAYGLNPNDPSDAQKSVRRLILTDAIRTSKFISTTWFSTLSIIRTKAE